MATTAEHRTDTTGELWLAKFPFGIYFGWVTVASILNATIALIYLNVQVSDSVAVNLGALLIISFDAGAHAGIPVYVAGNFARSVTKSTQARAGRNRGSCERSASIWQT